MNEFIDWLKAQLPTAEVAMQWMSDNPEIVVTAIVAIVLYRFIARLLWRITGIFRLAKKLLRMGVVGG